MTGQRLSARALVVAATFSLMTVACGPSAQQQGGAEGAGQATEAAPDFAQNFVAEAYHEAGVSVDGAVITVRRGTYNGEQGVYIRRVAGATGAAALRFSVRGEPVNYRITTASGRAYWPIGDNNTMMIGAGGATDILLYSKTADPIVITVSRITDCQGSTARACTPPDLNSR